MSKEKKATFLLKAIIVLIAVLPVFYFSFVKGVPYKAFIFGTGSWGIGLIFKMISHQLVTKKLEENNKPILLNSFLNGALSGFFELFAAFFIILLVNHKFDFDLNAIISFGLAIGSFECLIVVFNSGNNLLKGTSLEESSKQVVDFLTNVKGFRYYLFNVILPSFERILATIIHVSTRGLVFITFISHDLFPILFALVVFIFADGFLGYYYYLSGKLATGKGYISFYIYLFLISLLSLVVFIFYIIPYADIVL